MKKSWNTNIPVLDNIDWRSLKADFFLTGDKCYLDNLGSLKVRQSRWSSQEVGEVSNGQEERSHKGANQLSTDQMLVLLSHKG